MEREVIERVALWFIENGIEALKADVKRALPPLAELAKDLTAIANTDDHDPDSPLHRQEPRLLNHGLLILGADREQRAVLGFEGWEKVDQAEAHLQQQLRNLVHPVPRFNLYQFEQEGKRWAVVLVYPSTQQPHLFVREAERISRGDWYVRRGSLTERAQPEDYARVQSKVLEVAQDARRRAEEVERRLSDRIDRLESGYAELLQRLLQGASAPDAAPPAGEASAELLLEAASGREPSLAELVRLRLAPAEDRVHQGLLDEALRLRDFLQSDGVPWLLPDDPEAHRQAVRHLEEAAQPLAEGLGELIRRDAAEAYAPALGEALEILAEGLWVPLGVGSYDELARALHAYPLHLLTYQACLVAHAHRRAAYLRVFVDARIPAGTFRGQGAAVWPWLPRVRDRAIVAREAFQPVDSRWCEPLSTHTLQVLTGPGGWALPHLPLRARENPKGFFVQTEFLMALASLESSPQHPLIGVYLLEDVGSLEDLRAVVSPPPAHVCRALKVAPKELVERLILWFQQLSGPIFPGCTVRRFSHEELRTGECPPPHDAP
jgi:hypothetical protein